MKIWYVTRTCGIFSVNQLERMYEQKRYAREIKEAMDLVKSYQVGNSNILRYSSFQVGCRSL